jgi:hypothetical protein
MFVDFVLSTESNRKLQMLIISFNAQLRRAEVKRNLYLKLKWQFL